MKYIDSNFALVMAEKQIMCTEKFLVKIFIQIDRKDGEETPFLDSPVKKLFQSQLSVKKVMLAVFKDMKGHISMDFLEKGTTINNASYCRNIWQNSPYFWNKPHISCILFNQYFT